MLTRRELLAGLPATAGLAAVLNARATHAQTAQPAPTGPFSLPPLPYPADALEPHLDALTMTIHHGRHHAAYVTNLNNALASHADLKSRTIEDLVTNLAQLPEQVRNAVRNQGGGHLNHVWFWSSLKRGGGTPPTGELGKAIDSSFGSFAKFKDALTLASMGVFGSGWGWLSLDASARLVVETTPNQDNPLTRGNKPLFGIDVWEHAYYLKYQNRRRDYVDALFNVIDWDAVQERYRAARAR